MKNKAFTLIELIVVVTIIGILSGIVMVAVSDETAKARIAASQRFSHSIRTRLALDMVGRWPFDFSAFDFSGFNNHGTPLDGNHANADGNTPPQFTQGVTGQALSFDGVDDHVVIRDVTWFDGRVPWTIEFWMRSGPFRADNWGRILSDENSEFQPLLILRSPSANTIYLELKTAGGGWIMNRSTPFTPNQWHHLVFTYDGTTLTPYRDGVMGAPISSTMVPGSSPRNLEFGRQSGGGNHWDGFLDEVRIFRAAIPTSYIQKKYVQGIKDLVANGGISQEEKQQRIAELRNSGQLVIDLDAALVGPIDFSPYVHYFETLALEAIE